MSTQNPLSALKGRGIKPLVSLKTHQKLAIRLFLSIFIVGFLAVVFKGKVYTTNSVIEVESRYMKIVREDNELNFQSNTQYREYVQHLMKSLTRHDILIEAINELKDTVPEIYNPKLSESMQVMRLRNMLKISAIPDTYMVNIEIMGSTPKNLDKILNTVVSNFLKKIREEQLFGSDERVKILNQRTSELQTAILAKNNELNILSSKLGIAVFKGDEVNPYEKLLADLRESHNAAKLKRVEAEAKLDGTVKHGETAPGDDPIAKMVSGDLGLSAVRSKLMDRRTTLQMMITSMKPAHPAYKDFSAEIAEIDKELAAQSNRVKESILKEIISRYQSAVDQARQVEDYLKQDIDSQEKKGLEYATSYSQATNISHEIDGLRKELEVIRDRINYFMGEKNSFGFVRLITQAYPAEFPMGNKKTMLLGVILIALLVALAVPTVIDMLDRRIHTVNDVEKILGIPSTGWLIQRDDETTTDFGVDLLRRLASSLLKERDAHGTRLFALSSIKPAGGASELSLDIATTLKRLGYRTLVIETNAFKPDHRYKSQRPGLQAYLNQQATLADVITPASDTLPDRIAIGVGAEVKHLENIEHIKRLVSETEDLFDFVLIDMPPLLLSADTEILARTFKHMLIVVEAEGIQTGELRRAKRHLDRLGLAAMGFIVNRVRPFDGGGYMNSLMIEYAAGRKITTVMAEPLWLLKIKSLWMTLELRHPWIRQATKRFLATADHPLISRFKVKVNHLYEQAIDARNREKIARVVSQTNATLRQLTLQCMHQLRHLPRLMMIKALAVLGSLLILGALAWFLATQPGLWIGFISDETPAQQISLPIKPNASPAALQEPNNQQAVEQIQAVTQPIPANDLQTGNYVSPSLPQEPASISRLPPTSPVTPAMSTR